MTNPKQSRTRRDFLKKTIAGAAGLSLWPLSGKADRRIQERIAVPPAKKIIHRTLGRTGLKIPVVSMGVMNTENRELVQAALDAGVVHFDTAHDYGSEPMLGEVLKGRPRDSFVLATKIQGLRENRTGLPPAGVSAADYKARFNKHMDISLKRLQLDRVDILYLHGMNNPALASLAMVKDAMLELKDKGKTSFLGVSIHQTELPHVRAVADQKIFDVILLVYNFRQPRKDEVQRAVAYAAKAGLGIVAMKVFAGAYWDKERKEPVNTKAALKWALQDENIHTAIPGVTTFDQLAQNVAVMEDLALTAEERRDLRLDEDTAGRGLFCSQCGECRAQCVHGLEIPTAMRSYMYAYGYAAPAKAKETLRETESSLLTCSECWPCLVKCAMGFDVRERIMDITRLLKVPDEFLA